MRIISGIFKGKKILEPKNSKTRPLKDLTKESIFNIINHSNKFKINLGNSNILDLFSGVGSFGIECLSRGVNKVVFIENYEEALNVLKKNLISLKKINNFEILEKDIYQQNTLENFKIKFDIVFLDPPFKDKNLHKILFNIKEKNILNENGLIIIHRHKKDDQIFPPIFKIIEEKYYGISKINFIAI